MEKQSTGLLSHCHIHRGHGITTCGGAELGRPTTALREREQEMMMASEGRQRGSAANLRQGALSS